MKNWKYNEDQDIKFEGIPDEMVADMLLKTQANYRSNLPYLGQLLKRHALEHSDAGLTRNESVLRLQTGVELLRAIELHVTYQRLKRGDVPRTVWRIDLAAFLKEALRYVAFLMRQVSAQLLYSISHASFVVDADVESILTILGQLLSNAIRYRYKGTPVEVRVHFTEFHGKSMGVDIVNWGHDIPEEICPHICEPYYIYDHGDGARGGNGLGFTVVDQLVGALIGALYFHSENGETLFHFGYLFDDTRTGVQKLPRWEVGAAEWKTLLCVTLSDALPVAEQLLTLQ